MILSDSFFMSRALNGSVLIVTPLPELDNSKPDDTQDKFYMILENFIGVWGVLTEAIIEPLCETEVQVPGHENKNLLSSGICSSFLSCKELPKTFLKSFKF